MRKITDLSNEEAKKYFLKASSYFNNDLPKYLSFEPILDELNKIMHEKSFLEFKASNPNEISDVNYSLISNKDGKFAWRPLEIMHPVIYVSLVNLICENKNWKLIIDRFKDFQNGVVECCSTPVVSEDHYSDTAAQIKSWWQTVEQRSLEYSIEYSHLLHTDVVDCYGSVYTHSIAWALHGLETSKQERKNKNLLGNQIDFHIQSSRYGQTNGIAQGSVLMDFIAEIVLGYVDKEICYALKDYDKGYKILRYRDDYRIFTNNDEYAEQILQVISEKLRFVGMKLSVGKTYITKNVVEGSVKADKLAGIELKDLGETNAKTLQKQLLRLHSFGLKYTNSGALRRLVSEFHSKITEQEQSFTPDDLDVQIAIATDIAFVSPATFPAIAGILSYLLSLTSGRVKRRLWEKVRKKMTRIPYNGYLEIWLQRVIQPKTVGMTFHSKEAFCKIVNNETTKIWNNTWISSKAILNAIDVTKILIGSAEEQEESIKPEEIEIFTRNASLY